MSPFEPPQSQDAFSAAQNLLGGGGPPQSSGFAADSVPSVSGYGTRQSRIRNERPAVSSRNLMHWLIPEGPIVQMYINPQSVTYSDKKAISQQRTKGGFVLQYWGEELGTIRMNGTTGTSGIEGINVLRDIYRNEQLAIDPFALFVSEAANQAIINGGAVGSDIGSLLGGGGIANTVGGAIGGILQSGAQLANPNASRPTPSLAQLAFTVELYYSGEVYRGFFNDFVVTERADNIGLFDYDINFTVTQRRGFRSNFFGWHRSATSGPSDSDPITGRPHSYKGLVNGDAATPSRAPSTDGDILTNAKNSLGSLGDIF